MKNSGFNVKPPAHLSKLARKWWQKLVEEYDFSMPDSVLALEAAMESFDRMTAARELVEREGIVIADRFGQKKQHPATVVERDARAALLRALRQLGLSNEEPPKIGRPAIGH